MQDPTFWILVSLLQGEAHGYAITQRTLELSGELKLSAGTLYTALERLLGEGLIEKTREAIENGRARHYYELRPEGRRAIEAEIKRRDTVSRIAKAQLKLSGGVA
jgi:PadR family transcriptional regulator PadR